MSRRIFWDTNHFIYLLENRGPAAERVAERRTQMRHRGDPAVTAASTLGELLVTPADAQRADLCQRCAEILLAAARIVPFDAAAAAPHARVHRDHTIRPPDAIQLACAAAAGVDLFITNDDRLTRTIVPGVACITSLAHAPSEVPGPPPPAVVPPPPTSR